MDTAFIPVSLRELFTQLRERKSFGGGSMDSYHHGSDRVSASRSRILRQGFCRSQSHGGVRPVIDLSVFNKFIPRTTFWRETNKLVFSVFRRGDWMMSVDLQDANFQFLIHPESRKYLLHCLGGSVFPVQDSVLWAVNCTAGLHKGHGSSVSSPTFNRN